MKNFLLVTLVIGICIRNSIGKEKLKIDLPENFQADFMKTFARVMRSDYPNCDINPEEVLFKIGVEFLKRAGESGLDINLEDNNRSKRSIDPTSLVTKLKDKLGKRSIENDDEPTPAETNERQKRFITKLKSKIGLKKLVAKLKSKMGHGATQVKSKIGQKKLAAKKLTSKIGLEEALAAKLNVGQLGVISEDLSQERRRRGILPKLSKVAKLLAPAGAGGAYGKRSIDDNVWTPQDDAVAERSIETDAEIDQNREQRSAYEMLMDSLDEVNVKRNADFDQEIAKRKRRNALDLLMDTAQSRNMEF